MDKSSFFSTLALERRSVRGFLPDPVARFLLADRVALRDAVTLNSAVGASR